MLATTLLAAVAIAFGTYASGAGVQNPRAGANDELAPRKVTLQGPFAVDKALNLLQEKTGNVVVDRRTTKAGGPLKLDVREASFWDALDAMAQAAQCGVSLSQHDGKIALVDGPAKVLPTWRQGLFRMRVKRVALARNDDAGTHTCIVTIEVAWEPRFEPLYLEVGPIAASFADGAGKVLHSAKLPGEGRVAVAGRAAADIEVSFSAPPRAAQNIATLSGELKLLGPVKMLPFAFAKLKAGAALEQTKEGVTVTVKRIKTTANAWSFDVTIDNPPGNPRLESFESWLLNNAIHLEREAASSKRTWPKGGERDLESESPSRAAVQYSFLTDAIDQPGALADWTLIYRTPGRIVQTPAPFSFERIPLP